MGRKKKTETNKTTKNDLLNKTIAEINKEFGANTLKKGNDFGIKRRLLFSIPELNELTGGITFGNFTIIYGAESSTKTSCCYDLIAQAQKENLTCCLVDLEHSYEKSRAEFFGVNTDNLLVLDNIDYAEQAMDIVRKLCHKKVVDLIIIDSIKGFSPKSEQETKKGKDRSIEEDEMAILARKMDKFLRTTANAVAKAEVAVVLIGQTRTDLGSFGAPQTLSGGKAQKFWSVCTIKLMRSPKGEWPTKNVKEEIEDDEGESHKKTIKQIIGFNVIATLEKTKISGTKNEGSKVNFKFLFESGFEK